MFFLNWFNFENTFYFYCTNLRALITLFGFWTYCEFLSELIEFTLELSSPDDGTACDEFLLFSRLCSTVVDRCSLEPEKLKSFDMPLILTFFFLPLLSPPLSTLLS